MENHMRLTFTPARTLARTLALAAPFFALAVAPVAADDGLWLPDAFPSARVAKAYGFAPDQAWLDHLRLASVRLARGCSGSFVSPRGLVQTNHHCARDCIAELSTASEDLVEFGFTAKALEDERKCPDVEINQLIAMLRRHGADRRRRPPAATAMPAPTPNGRPRPRSSANARAATQRSVATSSRSTAARSSSSIAIAAISTCASCSRRRWRSRRSAATSITTSFRATSST